MIEDFKRDIAKVINRCEGVVSFCLHYHSDHHSNGWDSCPQQCLVAE
jgi:hypothetical protein